MHGFAVACRMSRLVVCTKMEMEYVSVKRYCDTLHKYQILANDTHVTRNGVFIAQAFIYFHLFICSPAATFLAFCVRFLTGISATAQHSAETERLQSTCPLHIDIKWKPT